MNSYNLETTMNKVFPIIFISLIIFLPKAKSQDYWKLANAAYAKGNDLLTIEMLDSLIHEFENRDPGLGICGTGYYALHSSVAVLKASSYMRLKEYRACRESITVNPIIDMYNETEADSFVIRSIIEQFGYRNGKRILRKATLNSKLHEGDLGYYIYFFHEDEQIRIYEVSNMMEQYHNFNYSLIGFSKYWRRLFLKQIKKFR